MGGCLEKSSFTVNKGRQAALRCLQPFLFGTLDAESVLQEAEAGDYLMYRDHESDRIVLSVRYHSYLYHHRITELNNLYYLDGQPYPYLDSIVLYHRKHKLNGLKLNKQAHISARAVRLFAHKVTSTNGNHMNTHAHGDVQQSNGGTLQANGGVHHMTKAVTSRNGGPRKHSPNNFYHAVTLGTDLSESNILESARL